MISKEINEMRPKYEESKKEEMLRDKMESRIKRLETHSVTYEEFYQVEDLNLSNIKHQNM